MDIWLPNLAVIGRDTWAALLDHNPGFTAAPNRRLLAWNLFGQHVHHNESKRSAVVYERVAIPSRRLAEIEGLEHKHATKHYVGRDFLNEYARTVPGFKYTGWREGQHYRQVEDDGLDGPTVDLLKMDLLQPVSDLGPAIGLWTACPVPSSYAGHGAVLRRQRAEAAAAEAQRREAFALCDEQRALLRLVNGTPGNIVAALVKRNAGDALTAAAAVGPEPGVESRLRHGLREMMRVRLLQYHPVTGYVPSPKRRTVRVHPLAALAIVSMRRSVRRALLRGCLGFDIRNCQLACAASVWSVSPLLDLLGRDGTAWDHLLATVGGLHEWTDVEAKNALKKAIYATTFGMGRQGVRLGLGRALSFTAASAFMADPIVDALFTRRDRALAEIDAAGGARDCLGVWYPVRPGREREAECRSALAATMQAQELRLLLPVVEDAARTAASARPQYRVAAWLHDGFYIKARYGADAVALRLQRAVQREADRLGIPTGLDVEQL